MKISKEKIKKCVTVTVLMGLIPLAVLLGVTAFRDRAYIWIALCVCLLACVPFFLSFEKRQSDTKRLMILAAMTAISVAGRALFYPLAHFKPVAAAVIITGMYLGGEAGFMCGALSALLSNFIFGQGPWTPFQMFSWGVIGLLAGIMSKRLKKSLVLTCIFGALAGVLYSLLMDIWTVLWQDGGFSAQLYLAAITAAAGVTAVYAVSNVVFLLLLARPVGNKLQRLITKYGLEKTEDASEKNGETAAKNNEAAAENGENEGKNDGV